MKPYHITKEEAKKILENIGEELKSFKPIKDKNSFCNPCSFVNNYVLRQVNPLWPNKAEAEVCAIDFARRIGIPAPKIVYWDKEHILMEKARGKILSKIWKNLDKKQKREYMKQIINYLELMQRNKSKLIGSIYRKGVGKSVDLQRGPYKNFRDFLLGDYDKRLKGINLPIKEKFIKFRKNIKNYNPKISSVFCHGDLELKNIFVEKGKITCIIDWEWSGFYPSILDYREIKQWCDSDLLEKSNLRKDYPKKIINHIMVASNAMCFASYKSWNIKNEKTYLKDLEISSNELFKGKDIK